MVLVETRHAVALVETRHAMALVVSARMLIERWKVLQ